MPVEMGLRPGLVLFYCLFRPSLDLVYSWFRYGSVLNNNNNILKPLAALKALSPCMSLPLTAL